ncbi:MAG: HutD family protein [Xanthomonadales bacterium]|nr:HutD family protein [Xanthomonadales bacterium]
MQARLLPAESFRRMRWLNGAGWTREIHRQPAQSEAFHWRASIAEIDADGPFSPFPGCQRQQALLRGNGLRLRFDSGEVVLEPPHGQHAYPGDVAVNATLIDGPVHAFNLIWRPRAVDVRVLHRPLVGATLFFPEPGVRWLVYLIQGQARLRQSDDQLVLAAGDALLLEPHDGAGIASHSGRRLLDGGGEALVCRIASIE